jgi:glycosyltransferase involved in cell wall biosynthesis
MNVLVISSNVFKTPVTGYAGLEVVAYECTKGLAGRGHKVALAAPDGSTCPGAEVIATGPERSSEALAYERYAPRLKDFDVLIDHSWQKMGLLAKHQGLFKGPSLTVMHAPVDTMWRTPPPVDKPCVVCISDDQMAHYEALFGRPAGRAYNGVDVNFYRATGTQRSGRYLFLARFSSIKGADLAIEACKRAGVGLDLVGDTSITNEPEYFNKCANLCDGEQIRMVGPASRGECVHWFSQAHALLHPNMRFREPFGLAPVEAMLCGCPVIAWRYGAMKETVAEGVNGYTVDSLDRMVELIKTDAAGRIDRDRCRKHATLFSLENMVTAYENLCTEALETGGW